MVQDVDGGIGADDVSPWELPEAAAYLQRVLGTARPRMRHAAIMGKNTFVALPPRIRPLPGAFSIVLNTTGRIQPSHDVGIARDLDTALAIAFARNDIDETFVVGGHMAFSKAIEHPLCHDAWSIRFMTSQGFDKFLPGSFALNYWLSSVTPPHDGAIPYRLERYRRRMPWPPEDME